MCAHQVRPYVRLVNTDDHADEPSIGRATIDHAPAQQYEIRVSGRLGSRWATWFGGMTLTVQDDDVTVIRGPVVDQAGLHGLLQMLRDLGVTLLSLTALAPCTAIEQPHATNHHIRNPNQHNPSGATP